VLPLGRRWNRGEGPAGSVAVDVVCCHDDLSVWFDLKEREVEDEGNKRKRLNPSERPPTTTFSASRMRMMNR
jgi:hypothetical protein